jgi:hypothetical protein
MYLQLLVSMPGPTRRRVCDVQILNVLEAVAQVAQEGVVEMLEHAALPDDVANALGPHDCHTASASASSPC